MGVSVKGFNGAGKDIIVPMIRYSRRRSTHQVVKTAKGRWYRVGPRVKDFPCVRSGGWEDTHQAPWRERIIFSISQYLSQGHGHPTHDSSSSGWSALRYTWRNTPV
jgi:hypothetical protein